MKKMIVFLLIVPGGLLLEVLYKSTNFIVEKPGYCLLNKNPNKAQKEYYFFLHH
jgi:hypothetical protein